MSPRSRRFRPIPPSCPSTLAPRSSAGKVGGVQRFPSTERRWNRTMQAEGCSALPVLKTGCVTDSLCLSRTRSGVGLLTLAGRGSTRGVRRSGLRALDRASRRRAPLGVVSSECPRPSSLATAAAEPCSSRLTKRSGRLLPLHPLPAPDGHRGLGLCPPQAGLAPDRCRERALEELGAGGWLREDLLQPMRVGPVRLAARQRRNHARAPRRH